MSNDDVLLTRNCELVYVMKKLGIMSQPDKRKNSLPRWLLNEMLEGSRRGRKERPKSRTYKVAVTHAGANAKAVRYDGQEGLPEDYGVFISGRQLAAGRDFFDIEILNTTKEIGILVVPYTIDVTTLMDCLTEESVSYWSTGSILSANNESAGPKFKAHEKIGCGIRPAKGPKPSDCAVYFTCNGNEIFSITVPSPRDGFYPAVCLKGTGELVMYANRKVSIIDEVVHMSVDNHEEDWRRLHHVKLNGQVLNYTGNGISIRNVGLAQASKPLNTIHYYFELEILDAGDKGYIAIGLTHKGYPSNRHPGWNPGSVAYHADDGKLFAGSGLGQRFGQRCTTGDTMGCGIYFPTNWMPTKLVRGAQSDIIWAYGDDGSSSSDEDDGVDNSAHQAVSLLKRLDECDKMKIFFTKNRRVIGTRDVKLFDGEFYPTIGMMSCGETVKVDLCPTTG